MAMLFVSDRGLFRSSTLWPSPAYMESRQDSIRYDPHLWFLTLLEHISYQKLKKGPNVTAFNVPGIPRSLLATLDENEHARYRRPIQNAYSLSNLKGYEPYVNEVIGKLATVLDRHVRDQTQINLSLWVYFCNPSPVDFLQRTNNNRVIRCDWKNHLWINDRLP